MDFKERGSHMATPERNLGIPLANRDGKSAPRPPLAADRIVAALVQLAECDPDVAVLWLYGSRARGSQRADSDYDLAVAFTTFIRDDPLAVRLRPELLAMDWRAALGLPERQLSVIDINQVSIPLAYQAINAQAPVFCRDGRRLLTENRRIESRMELDVYHLLGKKTA